MATLPISLRWRASTPTCWPALHPASVPHDRGPAFELRVDTGEHPMPRPRPMKRWSQGEFDVCRKQVAFLLDQGWPGIVPSSASHAASVV